VLTDVDLPGMTGLELLVARRRADAFLRKPVPAAQLVAVAEALIDAR
jgi:CheY-like chemotaxis protein